MPPFLHCLRLASNETTAPFPNGFLHKTSLQTKNPRYNTINYLWPIFRIPPSSHSNLAVSDHYRMPREYYSRPTLLQCSDCWFEEVSKHNKITSDPSPRTVTDGQTGRNSTGLFHDRPPFSSDERIRSGKATLKAIPPDDPYREVRFVARGSVCN